jgi:hypothetical protein
MLFGLFAPSLFFVFVLSILAIVVLSLLVEVWQWVTDVLQLELWLDRPKIESMNANTLYKTWKCCGLKLLVYEISDFLSQSDAIGTSRQGLLQWISTVLSVKSKSREG